MHLCTNAPTHCCINEPVHFSTNASAHRFTNSSRHTRTRSLTHQCIHARIHPFTYAPMHPHTDTPMHPCTRAPMHQFTAAPTHPRISAPMQPHINTPMHPRTNASTHRCTKCAHRCMGAPKHPRRDAPNACTQLQLREATHEASADVHATPARPRAPRSPPRRTCPGGCGTGSRERRRRAPAPTGTSAWPARAPGAGGRRRGRLAAAARCRRPWGGDWVVGGRRGFFWGGHGEGKEQGASVRSPGDAGEGPHTLGEDALVLREEGQAPCPFALPSRHRCRRPLIPSLPPNPSRNWGSMSSPLCLSFPSGTHQRRGAVGGAGSRPPSPGKPPSAGLCCGWLFCAPEPGSSRGSPGARLCPLLPAAAPGG